MLTIVMHFLRCAWQDARDDKNMFFSNNPFKQQNKTLHLLFFLGSCLTFSSPNIRKACHLLSAGNKRASCHAYRRKASFLIETMVVLPLFVCFAVFLLFHFRVMEIQSDVGQALSYTARLMAFSAYNEKETSDNGDFVNMTEAKVLFHAKLSEYGCPDRFIEFGNLGISLVESELDGRDIKLSAVYRVKLPVSVFGVKAYTITQNAVSAKWIGDRETSVTDEGKWVYITPSGKAYHTRTDCPYLDLTIRAVSWTDMLTLRNKSGAKYKACETCGQEATIMQLIYVTDYGDRYHSTLTCPGLKRTILMVKPSETGDRHACPKCGK